MLKKAILAGLGFVVSSVTLAGTMGSACTQGNVSVPCETRFWDFSVQALYLKSIYGIEKAYEFDALAGLQEIKNDWNWGFRIEGAYHFNTGNDISVNWMHFSTSINPTDFIGVLTIPPVGIPPIPAAFELISRNRLDQVNAVMGQHTAFSLRDKMRVYAGLQYANIESSATHYYTSAFIPASTPISQFDNTDYKGFGPAVGVDYAYHITEALSFTANGASSILIGTNRYHGGFVIAPFAVIPEQVFFRKKGVVPSLEAKLGLSYMHAIANGVATIQAGYQVVNYFNALEAQPSQNLLGPIRTLDYGLFGPYFGVKFMGNA